MSKALYLVLVLSTSAVLTAAGEQKDPLPHALKKNAVNINGIPYTPLSGIEKFYQLQRQEIDNNEITLRNATTTMKFKLGEQAVYINHLKFYLSEPVRKLGAKICLSQLDLLTLIDPLLRPETQKMPPMKTVILDPGHGGMDKGAANLESKYTLSLALKIEQALKEKNINVVLTRRQDLFVPLSRRVAIANAIPDGILVSLHFNAGHKNIHGFETYILSARKAQGTNSASVILANSLHSNCLRHLNEGHFKVTDRGIRRARFNVLSSCKHPSIILEAGFLTHEREAGQIQSEAFQQQLTMVIVKGVDLYRQHLPHQDK